MDTRDLPSGRLAFFFSDVEGSTRLLTDLGDRYAGLLAEVQREIRAAFAAHRGLEISTEGDSFFAVFGSSLDGVVAAATVQRALASHDWPDGHVFRVRIGVHVGQAIVAGGDYVGIDINRAARIANAAHGGQVILSEATATEVTSTLPADLALSDLGRHRLKDIGVVRLWQLHVDGLPTRFGPPRTLEAHPTNLPVELTTLVDRASEADDLERRVVDGPLVTVTGTGGIGKSRLALSVARRLVPAFPDGVFYLDLASLDRVDTAVAELAALTDARMSPDDDPATMLLAHLRDRRALLVLETADRPAGIATLIGRIAENCPTTRQLVTARSALHLRAEREFPIQPLPVPTAGAGLDGARSSAAVALFTERAQAIGPGFELNDANVEAVTSIVRRLDGLPLAIELAAAATRLLSPGAILTRLEKSLPLPGGATVDAPERQRTIRDTVAWSYLLLEPAERAMLARLSVFAGTFDLDGVMAVSPREAVPGSPMPDDVTTLAGLIDRSLVDRVGPGDDDRYRLLNVVREFASGELRTSGDEPAARRRHASYVLDVVRAAAASVDGADQMTAFATLDSVGDETRAALEWSIAAHGDARLGLELAATLGRAWYLRATVREAAVWLDAALTADPDAPPDLRARALYWLGVALEEQRDAAGAMARFAEALEIEREIGDERAIARELNSLGVVQRNIGELEAAERLFTESLVAQRRLDDRRGIATALTNLGILAVDRDRLGEAIAYLEEALTLDRATGSTAGPAYSASALGVA
ncbi:MAG TPA: tetratricopeptide repeat protein, partial [Candidatus Limnocylindrales bacterium]